MLVYSTGNGVHGFTYDPSIGEFILTVLMTSFIFSCESDLLAWKHDLPSLFAVLFRERGILVLLGATSRCYYFELSFRAKNWRSSLSGSKHQTRKRIDRTQAPDEICCCFILILRSLRRESCFRFPSKSAVWWDLFLPERWKFCFNILSDLIDTRSSQGKLRLLYECAPLGFIAEQAGGKVITNAIDFSHSRRVLATRAYWISNQPISINVSRCSLATRVMSRQLKLFWPVRLHNESNNSLRRDKFIGSCS